jgi:hypothetical protein
MKLPEAVHTALDELRMQMLGAQVLFGFQFEGVFQEGFRSLSGTARAAHTVGFGILIVVLGLLLAPCAQHRLVEKGIASRRIFVVAGRYSELALSFYAVAIGLDVFAVTDTYFGRGGALVAASLAFLFALFFWFGLGLLLKHPKKGRTGMPSLVEPPLHEKIDQMLLESRVILPGAQALLGFQFVVTMMQSFPSLPEGVRQMHFVALGMVLLSILLLLAPAAVHRMAFGGEDSERMHDIGSVLVTAALLPLAAGIAGDVYVALAKAEPGLAPWIGGVGSFILFVALWYALPLILRQRHHPN